MKKVLLLVPLLFILTGCSSGKIICTMTTPESETDYKMYATYTIYNSDEYVKSIASVERYTAKNIEELKNLEGQAKSQYSEYNKKYGGYSYKSSIKNNTLEVTVVIDYNILDLKEYSKDFPSVEQYMKNDKLTVKGAKELFKMLGATCR